MKGGVLTPASSGYWVLGTDLSEQVFKTWAVSALVLAALYFVGPWWLLWWVKR